MDDQYCLKWGSHTDAITDKAFKFLEHESLVDVTLVCQEYSQTHFFKAHQIILSACSPYFESLFLHNTHPHPIVFLKDVKKNELEIILMFMYRGEVHVQHDKIKDILETAKSLMIRGLSDDICEVNSTKEHCEVKRSISPENFTPKKKRCENELLMDIKTSDSGPEDLSDNYDSKYAENNSSPSYSSPMAQNSESMEQMNHMDRIDNPMDYSVDSYRDGSANHHYQALRNYEEKVNVDRYDTMASTNYPVRKSNYYLSDGKSDRNGTDGRSDPPIRYKTSTSQEISVIQANSSSNENILSAVSFNVSSTPLQGPKRVGHFQLKWMELFTWLEYDKDSKKMFCRFCRKWGDLIPNIRRTSFVDGSCNFRFEIVKHHDCSKSHQICMHKEEVNDSVTEFNL